MLPTPQDLDPDFPLPLRGGPGEPLDTERRYFLNFPGVNQYVSIPEVTLTGDFEISLICRPSSNSTQMILAAGDSSNNAVFVADGNVTFRDSSGANTVTSGGPVINGQLNSVTIRKNSGVVSIVVNGVIAGTGSSSSNFRASRVGVRFISEAFYFDGVIASLRITDNGTPVRFYPLDDNATTIRDTIGGNNGTYINGAAADWGRFERQYGGDWLGRGLTVPPWDSPNQVLPVA